MNKTEMTQHLEVDVAFLLREAKEMLSRQVAPDKPLANMLLAQQYMADMLRAILAVQTDIPEE